MVHCTGHDLSRSLAAKTSYALHAITDIELYAHTYAIGVADVPAREGSPTMCCIRLVMPRCTCAEGIW